jgi:hypothetical protein
MRKLSILVLLVFITVWLLGCTGFTKREYTSKGLPLLEPSAMLKFSDVPVPAGFKPLREDSYSFESSGVRVGVLKYRGKADPDQVVNFYKEQMPMYNWVFLNVVEYGDRLINFERENETCIISLLPKGNLVTLTISLGPKSQVYKKANKPVK